MALWRQSNSVSTDMAIRELLSEWLGGLVRAAAFSVLSGAPAVVAIGVGLLLTYH